jgi:hypothetical protein
MTQFKNRVNFKTPAFQPSNRYGARTGLVLHPALSYPSQRALSRIKFTYKEFNQLPAPSGPRQWAKLAHFP